MNNIEMSNIEFLRKEAGLTLRQLADRTGISFSMISQIERGEKKMSPRCASELSDALLATTEFLKEDEERGIRCWVDSRSTNREVRLNVNEYIRLKQSGRVYESKDEFTICDKKGNPIRKVCQIMRYIKESAIDKKSWLIEEIENALQTMTEKDLNKVLVILRDVMEVM